LAIATRALRQDFMFYTLKNVAFLPPACSWALKVLWIQESNALRMNVQFEQQQQIIV